jgi:uncharacterized protein YdeI (BOF family)
MNRKSTFLSVAAMTVAVAVVPAAGLESKQVGGSQRQQFTIQGWSSDKTKAEIFTGTIWMNGGQFVLRDEHKHLWYQLDDQKWAGRFEGKEVKIVGTLDAAENEIHVQRIEED